jgi:hypothetical protein
LPGRRNGFGSFQLRYAFISDARVGFFPALYSSSTNASAVATP